MGIISGAVLEGGGEVIGVVPWAMIKTGGEGDKGVGVENVEAKKEALYVMLDERGREKVNTIIVDSMHERKIEMAKRVGGFIGLPGGFGTLEEILEVITWTQLGIHNKRTFPFTVHFPFFSTLSFLYSLVLLFTHIRVLLYFTNRLTK